jgi:predicted dehydrogenase
MPEINVALIGYAFMGRAHSNAYRQVSRFFSPRLTPRMKVLCGRDAAAVRKAAANLGWEETATDWRRVVERDDVDVVDVVTPGDSHAEIAIAAARAGKTVFCEKPLANTLRDAKAMLAAVKRAGVAHMICHNYRRAPAVQLARQLIAPAGWGGSGTTAGPTCRTGSWTRRSRSCGGCARRRRAPARWATSRRTASTWPASSWARSWRWRGPSRRS